MKKLRSAASIILIVNLLVLTACTEEADNSSQKKIQSGGAVIEQTTIESNNSGEGSGENKESVDLQEKTTDGNGVSVIAKSNNIVSDSEKKKVLDEVNAEIDSLIKNVNELEDVQEADLNY